MLAGELLLAELLLLLATATHASLLRSLAPEQRESTSKQLRGKPDGSPYACLAVDGLPASLTVASERCTVPLERWRACCLRIMTHRRADVSVFKHMHVNCLAVANISI
jgi:hypothetical protein